MLDNRLASAPYNVIGLTPLSCKATTRPTSMLRYTLSSNFSTGRAFYTKKESPNTENKTRRERRRLSPCITNGFRNPFIDFHV